MIVCAIKDSSHRKRFLPKCNFTLSKAISAGHSAEEISRNAHKTFQPTAMLLRKHVGMEILRSQRTAGIGQFLKRN